VTTGLCILVWPDYPTNIPCDAHDPAIQVTLELPHPVFRDGAINLELPGSGTLTQRLQPGTSQLTLLYPAGTVAGPATAIFFGDQELSTLDGRTTFTADPTSCTMVTIQVQEHVAGSPDAGM
jgi:hypothetical protein